MIIDAHTHGYHGKSFDKVVAAGGSWITREYKAFSRERAAEKPTLYDVDLRLEHLKRNNIDLQIVTPGVSISAALFPGDTAAQIALARAINDNMARFMEDSKGKMITGGSVPIANFEQGGLQELERAINSLGLKSVTIPSNVNGKPLDLPEFEPFWAHVAEMGVPIYIHPYSPANFTSRSYEEDFNLFHNLGLPYETALALSRLVFTGIMERYPTLTIISHHLGGQIPFFWERIMERYGSAIGQQRNLGRVLPKPLFDYFSLFYHDTAVGGSVAATRCAYEVFGASQLVFGTDYPLGAGTGEERLATFPNVIRALGLSEAENEQIFEGNARKILKI